MTLLQQQKGGAVSLLLGSGRSPDLAWPLLTPAEERLLIITGRG